MTRIATGCVALGAWAWLAWGCATTGMGGAGGPASAAPLPPDLQGSLKGGVYAAPDGTFSVASPYGPGSGPYVGMEIKELYGPEDSYVSFAPGGGHDVYRVDVSRTHTPRSMGIPLEAAAPILVRVFADQLESLYGTALIQQRHERVRVAGHPAEFWTFTQRIPAAKTEGRGDTAETDYVYIVDGGATVATLWAEIPDGCARCEKGPASDLFLPYAPADRFVRSFAFGAGAGAAAP
jgi:hypothetical protein